jgi:hypothetical protein
VVEHGEIGAIASSYSGDSGFESLPGERLLCSYRYFLRHFKTTALKVPQNRMAQVTVHGNKHSGSIENGQFC